MCRGYMISESIVDYWSLKKSQSVHGEKGIFINRKNTTHLTQPLPLSNNLNTDYSLAFANNCRQLCVSVCVGM